MITNCPVCGKAFDVLWPHLWSYKREKLFLCSWKCLRLFDGKGSGNMYTKTKADGSPAKKPGPKTKTTAEKIDIAPESGVAVITKLPEKKITQPVSYDGMIIREVEGLFGRYRYSDIGSTVYIDFENADGMDTLSLTVEQWKSFREEQTKAAAILGVEL